MTKSPSVSIIERDMSTYSVTSSSTAIAVIGYATKGPVGVPTTVTSLKDFREIFGYAALIPYSYLAVLKAFNQTNKVIFTRVADETASSSQRVINNLVTQVNGYTTLTKSVDVPNTLASFHNGEIYGLTVASRNLYITSPATGGWAIDNILSKLTTELGATRGYQEFTSKASLTSVSGVYGFKATLNGGTAGQAWGSTGNLTCLIEVTNSDNLATLATKINSQIANGTRSYSSATLDASVSALPIGTYKFKVAVGAVTATEYSITTTTEGVTYTVLAGLMNAACAAATLADEGQRVGVFGVENSNVEKIVIYSKAIGITTSAVLVTSGAAVDLLTYGATDLLGAWTPINAAPAVTGEITTGILASKHIDTSRLRLTSMAAAGTGSSISIIAPDAPFDNVDSNLITLLTSIGTAVPGKASLSTVTASRDLTSRKIKFTAVNNVTAPVVASLSAAPAAYTLSTLLTGIDSSVTGTASVDAAASDKVIIESQEHGSATNLIVVEKSTVTDVLTQVSTVTVEVYYNNLLKETFTGMSLTLADTNFIENVINASTEDGGSSWITITTVDTNSSGSVIFPDGIYSIGAPDATADIAYGGAFTEIGTYNYKLGTDGIPSIGGEELFLNVLDSSGDLANDEINDFHILVTPDNTTQAVQDAAISLAESRGDFIYIVDPAFGLSYSQARDWHNGIGNNGRDAAVNSSYAAVYWPWLKEYDSDNAKYVWCPPSVFVGEKLLEIDRVYNPWYAPAGDSRGRIVAQDIETSPSFAQREELYGDLNCINPIVNFASKGIEIYGQKTALRQLVASNRINVKRMLIHIKKLVRRALNSMIFEPNNPDSWQIASNLVTAILEPIRQDNGLSQYRVIIDGTVNTPDVIAMNQMKGVIKLIPTNTIEMIEMNINVYASGTSIA